MLSLKNFLVNNIYNDSFVPDIIEDSGTGDVEVSIPIKIGKSEVNVPFYLQSSLLNSSVVPALKVEYSKFDYIYFFLYSPENFKPIYIVV